MHAFGPFTGRSHRCHGSFSLSITVTEQVQPVHLAPGATPSQVARADRRTPARRPGNGRRDRYRPGRAPTVVTVRRQGPSLD